MNRSRIQLFSAVLILLVLSVAGAAGAAEKPHWRSIPPLGVWSSSCDPAFMLAAMPDAWVFNPKEGALHIITHVAIDFERLTKDDYVVALEEGGDHDRFYDLTGYNVMALEADVRALGRRRILASIPGIYGTDRGKDPVIFSFDGRDSEGNLLPPGIYEIEVRGRFVPTWMGLSRADQPKYHDLDGWNMVAEACRRPLRIEITEKELGNRQTRGTSCAAPPATYYDSVDATTSTTLRNTLNPVIKDHTRFPYSSTSTDAWDILNDADENPSNVSQLLAIYKNDAYADGCSSGCSWNREHVWAKSYGFKTESGNGRIPYTDCHHLHAANAGYNSTRSNKPFNTCPGCTTYATVANNGFGGGAGDVDKSSGGPISSGTTPSSTDIWEPWDHRKGDVARSMLYMDIRYEGITGVLGGEQDLILTDSLGLMLVGSGYQDPAYLGLLSTLVTWSDNDPPDSDEQRRNDQVWCYQGNRNPFVDHPEWVDCLYLNSCSGSTTPVFGGIDSATDLNGCAATGVDIAWTTPSNWNDGCSSSCSRGFRVYRSGTAISSGGCAGLLGEATISCTDTAGTAGTTYTYTVEAVNDLGSKSAGGTSAVAADATDDGWAPTITSGPSASATSSNFTVSWTTNEVADSYLEWGTTSGSYLNNTSDATDVTAHSLTANGLAATTTYYYRVCSTDPCGYGPTCSAEATVATSGGSCDPGTNTPVFINEFHYDNNSTDVGEFVEVAGPAGTDLSNWSIAVYNGNGGGLSSNMSPNPVPLTGIISDSGSGYGVYSKAIAGLENGAPDGLALVNASGTVVQFLSYEGSFTATAGPASGMTSTDVGVAESSTGPIGFSLQLTGGPGFVYEDFSWSGPAADSPGSLNSGQTMECTPPPSAVPVFTARATSGQIILEWLNSSATTYSSTMIRYRTDTYPSGPANGTEIYNSGTAGAGNYASFTHTGLTNGQTYYYAAWTVSTDAQYSSAAQVSAVVFDSSAKEKWRYSSGASSLAPPGIHPGAVDVGEILAVSNDRYLHGMKPTASGGNWPRSGGYSWTPPLMNAPASHRPPIVPLTAGPRVFLASEDGYAYSFNAHSGALAWKSASLGSVLQANPGLLSSDLVAGAPDLLLIGTRESSAANTLFALDPSTGTTNSAMSFTNSSAQGGDDLAMGIITGVYADYGNDYAYFTSRENSSGSNHTVWCVDLSGASVSLVWSAALGNIDAAPVLYSGRVYVGTTAGDVVALDALTGAVRWTKSTGDGAVKAFVFPRFGTLELYFSTTNKVWGLKDNGSSYSDLWGVSTVSFPSAPVQLPGTTLLYVGGGNGTLYQLNMTNGGVDASLALSTAALGIPSADVVNSTLQVGSEDGRIHLVGYPLN